MCRRHLLSLGYCKETIPRLPGVYEVFVRRTTEGIFQTDAWSIRNPIGKPHLNVKTWTFYLCGEDASRRIRELVPIATAGAEKFDAANPLARQDESFCWFGLVICVLMVLGLIFLVKSFLLPLYRSVM